MWRYLVGMAAGIVAMAGGLVWYRTSAGAQKLLPDPPVALAGGPSAGDGAGEAFADPPQASAKTREEKRFARYDRDKDGKVTREEFLAARRKAFAKLDTNHDGVLSFDEYAVKTATRFAGADADRSGALTPAEFATTRIARKQHRTTACPPAREASKNDEDG